MRNAKSRCLRQALESIGDLIYITDTRGSIIDLLGNWESEFGPSQIRSLRNNPALLVSFLGENHQNILSAALHGSRRAYRWAVNRGSTTSYYESILTPTYDTDHAISGAIGICRNITSLRENHESLLRINKVYSMLAKLNEAIAKADTQEDLFNRACDIAVKDGQFCLCWVGLCDDTSRTIHPAASAGEHAAYLQDLVISYRPDSPYSRGPTAQSVVLGHYVSSDDIANDPQMTGWKDRALQYGFQSSIAFPLTLDKKIIGAISLYADSTYFFTEHEIDLLQSLANVLSLGIELMHKESLRQKTIADIEANSAMLSRILTETVESLSLITESHDAYTAGHQQRVAALAVAIGEELQLPHSQLEALRIAGLLHDIGKISIPIEFLVKPTKLTPLEFTIIKGHCKASYDILKKISFPWPIADMALQHHERIDGSGYPHGIQHNEILLESRILCVADVIEAMASHRPYRPALGVRLALDEINNGRGSVYDSDVVSACNSVINRQPLLLAGEKYTC